MKRSVPRAALLPGALALCLSLLVAGAWAGVTRWYPHHIYQVTGRADLPELSCRYCHDHVTAPPAGRPGGSLRYPSPEGMAVSANGGTLFVAAPGTDELLVIDLASRTVRRRIAVPGHPRAVGISADGRRLAIACEDADRVVVLDTLTLSERRNLRTGPGPRGIALSGDGRVIFVADGKSDDVMIAPGATPGAVTRLAAGNEPFALALSRDGRLLVVANRQARPAPPGVVPLSEITLIDTAQRRVIQRRAIASVHRGEGVAIASDGSFALATLVHVRNLLPLTQVARGAVMNSALAFLETRPGGRTVEFPLSDVTAFYADPAGVVMTPDDRIAFVAHAGARTVTALDVGWMRRFAAGAGPGAIEASGDDLGLSSRYVLARIRVREGPRSLAISPDGRRLYVAESLADSIGIIDVDRLAVVGRIDLGGPSRQTPERRGERIFHDAAISFQGQFSCSSCHPDGHTDGLVWDFEIDGVGKNLVETRSLRGIRDTAPFKWNGKNPDLATQCGPRFARVLTRSEPFTPDQLADLVAYIRSIPLPPRRRPPGIAAARERGRAIFFRSHTNTGGAVPLAQRCVTCHRPPLFTDRLMADVGTGGRFDTPHLFDVADSPPYLHDGRALTLEEIWTIYSPKDTHGLTSDLSKVQLNELVTYLRSL